MGKVYDFLEFLNQGVLPNTSQRPRSPLLAAIVDYGRAYLSRTGAGDIVLWMLDHGIVFNDDNLDSEGDSHSDESSRCETVDGRKIYTFHGVGSTFSSRGDGTSIRSSGRERRIVNGTDIDGYSIYQTSNITIREYNFKQDSHSSVDTIVSSWTRSTSGVWIGRLKRPTISYPPASPLLPPGLTGVYFGANYVTETSIPVEVVPTFDSCYTTLRTVFSYCGIPQPDPIDSDYLSCELIAELPPDPPWVFPKPPILFGDVRVYFCGGQPYYPAWSSLDNFTREQAIAFLSSLPMESIRVPVLALSADPLARRLFGDIDPPLWYAL